MQIDFERSGGFTGMYLTARIDTDALPEAEAQELRELVEDARLFELPPEQESTGADQFEYRLTVHTGDHQHTVFLTDAAASEALQRLLRRLTVLARSAR